MLGLSAFLLALGLWAGWASGAGLPGGARFVAMNLAVCWSAHGLVKMGFHNSARSRQLLLGCLFFLGQIVITSWVLGFVGLLHVDVLLAAQLVILAAVTAIRWATRGPTAPAALDEPAGYRAAAVILASMAMFAVAGYARFGLALPVNHIDDMTHHLRFPVEWMKAGRVTICFAPFGYDAPSYAPCNTELFFLWLLLPLRADVLAKIGQVPFLLAGAVAAYRLAYQIGRSRSAALAGAALLLLSPAALRQSVDANVDVALAFLLVSCVSCLVDYYRDRRLRSLAALGMTLGLMLGTKLFSALPMLLLLAAGLPAFFGRGGDRWRLAKLSTVAGRAAIGAAMILLFGGFWYIRNWIVTGSALYPMAVRMFGATIMPGAYDRHTMAATAPIPTDGLLAVLTVALGHKVLAGWAMLSVVTGGLAAVRRGRLDANGKRWDWVDWGAFAAPVVYIAVLRPALPYSSPNHFLPAAALAAAACGAALAIPHRGQRFLAVTMGVLCLAQLLPVPDVLPTSGLLAGTALVTWPGLPAFIVSVVLASCVMAALQRAKAGRWRLRALPLACLVTWLMVCYVSRPRPGEPVRPLVLFYVRDYGAVVVGWGWTAQNVHGEVIAHTGDNMPYPLYGRRFENDVRYVNIDEHFRWRFHDYELHERRLLGYEPPRTEKPGYYRRRPKYDAWLANLRRHRATLLFVAAVHMLDADYNWLDAERFPIERGWADAHPKVFQLVFENDRVKIYRIAPAQGAGG